MSNRRDETRDPFVSFQTRNSRTPDRQFPYTTAMTVPNTPSKQAAKVSFNGLPCSHNYTNKSHILLYHFDQLHCLFWQINSSPNATLSLTVAVHRKMPESSSAVKSWKTKKNLEVASSCRDLSKWHRQKPLAVIISRGCPDRNARVLYFSDWENIRLTSEPTRTSYRQPWNVLCTYL